MFFTWEEYKEYELWEEYSREVLMKEHDANKLLELTKKIVDPTNPHIKYDTLLHKDQQEVIDHTINHMNHTMQRFITTGTGKSSNALPELKRKAEELFAGNLSFIDIEGIDIPYLYQWYPELISLPYIDEMDIDFNAELKKELSLGVLGLGKSSSIIFDEVQLIKEKDIDTKKDKSMREGVRSFLNKGRKW